MRTLLLVVVAALVLAAAVASGTVHAKTFTYANQGDALSMDPHMFNEALLLNFTGNLYEALVGRGRKLELQPELATDWKRTAATVWRFNLRKGVKFHDGTPFTADDVIFSYERARGGWNGEQEKADTLAYLDAAREKFRSLAGISTKD